MLVLAPLLPGEVIDTVTNNNLPALAPLASKITDVWSRFTHFDGKWYWEIATYGYDYNGTQPKRSIAFFPLFPIVISGIMRLGVPYPVAAVLFNNLAFFVTLILLHSWVKNRHGVTTARWTTAILAWCPYSIFTTIAYSESLFLLSSVAALKAFDQRQHIQAGFWGAIATATRITGSVLVPTFWLVAWKEKRPIVAYLSGLFASVGILSFILYCAISFGDPLAFLNAQKAWGVVPGTNNLSNWSSLLIKSTFINGILPAVNSWVKLVSFFGTLFLLWYVRKRLSLVAVVYGFCYLGLIFLSGATQSVIRFVYALVPLAMALGIIFDNNRRNGVLILNLSAITLLLFSILSYQGRWIG